MLTNTYNLNKVKEKDIIFILSFKKVYRLSNNELINYPFTYQYHSYELALNHAVKIQANDVIDLKIVRVK